MGPHRRFCQSRFLFWVRCALVIVLALVLSVVAVGAQPLDHTAPVSQPAPAVPQTHEPPVDAPIVDPYRPPPQPWLPGNRGIEYGPTTGQLVRASASGTVTFAGPVAGNLFVTIAHDATLRTTVGFLSEVLVASGEEVAQGQVIARAGATLHFSARRNGIYLDPATLFQRYEVRVRLVE